MGRSKCRECAHLGHPCFRCWRTCNRKQLHQTRQAAEDARNEVAARYGFDLTLEIYCCLVCEGFHLGHLPAKQARHRARRAEKARRKTLWKIPAWNSVE